MKVLLLSLVLILTISCTVEIPEQNWKKGNLHTHSLWSDGDDFPEMIIQWYKDHNYQFIALSDHNTIASDEDYWYRLRDREIKNKTLEKYQEQFGDWVEVKDAPDSTKVRLKTFAEYKAKLEDPGNFLIIKSEEVTSDFEGKPVHINVTNIQNKIQPVKGTSVLDVMQRTIDATLKQRKETGAPMFAHINHPNFHYGVSTEDFKNLNGERFFEVYNGHPAVNNEGDDSHPSIEKMWDMINVSYIQNGKPLLLGVATDDSHNYHVQSSKHSNTGRGWVMVESESLDTNSLIDAMESGLFYASSGVDLKTVHYSDNSYTVVINPADKINYEIIFYAYKQNSDDVVEVFRQQGITATYKMDKDDVFVRAKIISDQKISNPYREGETSQAWTQPVLSE